MTPEELTTRTKALALRILRLVEQIPKSVAGRAVAAQIVRSGTSVAANYRAACKARSKAEFVAKIGVVEEEADETVFWLELLSEGDLLPANRLEPLRQEAVEIERIMAASRIQAAKKGPADTASPSKNCQ